MLHSLALPDFYFRFSQLGSKCIQTSVDVDQEDWSAIEGWITAVTNSLLSLPLKTAVDYLDLSAQEGDGEGGFSRTRPFMSTMMVSMFEHARGDVTCNAVPGQIFPNSNGH